MDDVVFCFSPGGGFLGLQGRGDEPGNQGRNKKKKQ
jgi:hypothetical protein